MYIHVRLAVCFPLPCKISSGGGLSSFLLWPLSSESTSALHCPRIHICVYNARAFKFASTTPENSNLRPQHIRIYIYVTIPRNSHLRLQRIRIDICIYNASESTSASQLTIASTMHQNWHLHLQRIRIHIFHSEAISLSLTAISRWQPYLINSHISLIAVLVPRPPLYFFSWAISLSLTAISRWQPYLVNSPISLTAIPSLTAISLSLTTISLSLTAITISLTALSR